MTLLRIVPVLVLALGFASPAESVKTGSLTVRRTTLDGEEPFVVTVSLYRDGELIRSRNFSDTARHYSI